MRTPTFLRAFTDRRTGVMALLGLSSGMPLLLTGGTMQAAGELVETVGAEVVGIDVVIELADLQGRQRLAPHKIHALISYGSSAEAAHTHDGSRRVSI